jgi:hypothetical protein
MVPANCSDRRFQISSRTNSFAAVIHFGIAAGPSVALLDFYFKSSATYSAATVCGSKPMPRAFATPAPYAGSALAQLAI